MRRIRNSEMDPPLRGQNLRGKRGPRLRNYHLSRRGSADSLASVGPSGLPRDPWHGEDVHFLGSGGRIAPTWDRLLFAGGRFQVPINVSNTRGAERSPIDGNPSVFPSVGHPIHLVFHGDFYRGLPKFHGC